VRRVVWFEEPAAALADPIRFMTYAMASATHEDKQVLRRYVSDEDFVRRSTTRRPASSLRVHGRTGIPRFGAILRRRCEAEVRVRRQCAGGGHFLTMMMVPVALSAAHVFGRRPPSPHAMGQSQEFRSKARAMIGLGLSAAEIRCGFTVSNRH
jgi:hypothetical protein